jgi:hypothetical protein
MSFYWEKQVCDLLWCAQWVKAYPKSTKNRSGHKSLSQLHSNKKIDILKECYFWWVHFLSWCKMYMVQVMCNLRWNGEMVYAFNSHGAIATQAWCSSCDNYIWGNWKDSCGAMKSSWMQLQASRAFSSVVFLQSKWTGLCFYSYWSTCWWGCGWGTSSWCCPVPFCSDSKY